MTARHSGEPNPMKLFAVALDDRVKIANHIEVTVVKFGTRHSKRYVLLGVTAPRGMPVWPQHFSDGHEAREAP